MNSSLLIAAMKNQQSDRLTARTMRMTSSLLSFILSHSRVPISCLFINIFMAVPYKKSPGNFVIFDSENLENLEFFRCQNIPTRHYKALDSSVSLLITWSTSFRRASYFYFHIIIWRVSGASLLTDITFNKKVKTINFV